MREQMSKHIVIVGGGYAGASAAISARKAGFEGSIHLIGEEDGLAYERPPLSKWQGEGVQNKPVFPESFYGDSGISVHSGERVESINIDTKQVVTRKGLSLTYDKLILATGATARTLPGFERSERVHYLRTLQDAQKIQRNCTGAKKVVLIGAGFIGLELAASIRAMGIEVTVIEQASQILSRAVPTEIANILHGKHVENGVEFKLGEVCQSMLQSEQGVVVQLESGESVEADCVVVGIGSVPNTQLAEQAGLLVENGILVDETLRTSNPHIYAAGDCCRYQTPVGCSLRLESWLTAGQQGTVAGKNAAGENSVYSDVPYFWSDQMTMTLQVTGYPNLGTKNVTRKLADDKLMRFQLDEFERVMCVAAVSEGNALARDVRAIQKAIAKGKVVDSDKLKDPSHLIRDLV
ncbi:putative MONODEHYDROASCORBATE REDUCTASE (NADH) [Vibrio nigripulchritudo SFn27]|nr:putative MONODEHYDROASCORBATE REDUCTASE (NADH) [Vibrio nigripulchritudo BLFn1]CCN89273.1 putative MONODEHYDROASCORBATE REDUCTASE (NADH) [Vibrio nigripulchritudo SFn27]CCN93072.1 putative MONODEHYDROASCORBATE REDUCTASE (NADH) [Vibrio nigripulchritudo ENn2]CCO40397.1 putative MONODEHYDROASCORBATE REDUCTASE (NADH) [Vibrio nigripulchritudo SFn135]CCO55684.1 putative MONODEHYDROASCORBATE REDUCTASE (NADH) [Vibrio nigripulchritudo Wn13]